MFANDTSLFYSDNRVKESFRTVIAESSNLNDWFCVYKLSLNTDESQ